MNPKKFLITIASAAVAFQIFANAGFAGRFDVYLNWIIPAIIYCFTFGAIILILEAIICRWIFNTQVRNLTEKMSSYLKAHDIWGIIVSVVLSGIVTGLFFGPICVLTYGVGAILGWGLLIVFPIIFVSRANRVHIFLSPGFLKWILLICISMVLGSLLFIILTNSHMLPHTRGIYQRIQDFEIFTHPYDSVIDIWGPTLIFVCEAPITVVLYWLIKLFHLVSKKINHRLNQKESYINAKKKMQSLNAKCCTELYKLTDKLQIWINSKLSN